MKEIEQFLNELGFSYGYIIDREQKAYLVKAIKSLNLNLFNDRLYLIETYTTQIGGFRIVYWDKLIDLDVPLTIQLKKDISDLLFCFCLEIHSGSRQLKISTDPEFLGTSDMGVVLSDKEKAFGVLFPGWVLISPFIDELMWEDKKMEMMMRLIKGIILKSGFIGNIYERLPELLREILCEK
ncbi:hypothetical protein [Bacillus toyonensis]|uniref:hypothetical protein n=1 Tax=Bacillus toyonensis TaxID=155322 RepID=UPI002E21435A|nr:hypothetical protein [Bacillus toyonensis]